VTVAADAGAFGCRSYRASLPGTMTSPLDLSPRDAFDDVSGSLSGNPLAVATAGPSAHQYVDIDRAAEDRIGSFPAWVAPCRRHGTHADFKHDTLVSQVLAVPAAETERSLDRSPQLAAVGTPV
jgi:NAD(P)H-dependent FMN reductase